MGPHPQIVRDWTAAYSFDCGERHVSVGLAVTGGVAHVLTIDLGKGPVTEELDALNEALAGQEFNDLVVTCSRTNPLPQVMFRTYRTTSDGGAESSAVLLEAIGAKPNDIRLVER